MEDAAQWARDAAIYERILAQMGDGVVSLDLTGRIITFNGAAGRILGRVPAETTGVAYAKLFFSDARFDALNELILDAIGDTTRTHSAEVELPTDGEARYYLVTTSFLETPDGAEKLGIIVVLHDVTAQRKRRRLKRLFGEYLDPRIVERLLDRAVALERGAREVMSVSFLDLQGFSGIAEQLDATTLLDFLNAFLSTMSRPIGDQRGVTDKYIGDAIMAFWGPPFTPAGEDAAAACAAALEQRRLLPALRRRAREELGIPAGIELEIRSGIATGEVLAGTLGPASSRCFTVVGDVVNVAARLEAANKLFGTRILVSEATRVQAGDGFVFRDLAQLRVRGRARPESIFELVAEADRLSEAGLRLCGRFAEGMASYRSGRWWDAAGCFGDCLAMAPDDGPARIFRERALLAAEMRRPPDWADDWPAAALGEVAP
jgi:adenylate cyclase